MILIVDYGMGNPASIKNMLKYIGYESMISSNYEEISIADKLILPGVGAFDQAMANIDGGWLRGLLDKKALNEKVPILGICLGMQILTLSSEEGQMAGLGWIKAHTVRFKNDLGLKVPHMGWNSVQCVKDSDLTKGFYNDVRFYFVHSYYVQVSKESDCIIRATYGTQFAAGIQHENIYGVQFHPEKSHKFGMQLLKNFAEL